MNVLVILGSPKRDGHTTVVLDHYLKAFNDAGHHVETLFLRGMKMIPCIDCAKCKETGECAIPDDMTLVYQNIKEAQFIVMASPVYFNSVSSFMKIMIDRCQVYWSKKFVLKDRKKTKDKDGVLICTAGVKHDEETLIGATKVVDLFFKAVDANYLDTLWVDDTDKIPAIDQTDTLKNIEVKALKHLNELEAKYK